jgi:hypothetical protein
MVFNQGLVGPKEKPKGVPDGQLVNIPTLGYYSNTLHNVVILAHYRIWVPGLRATEGKENVAVML